MNTSIFNAEHKAEYSVYFIHPRLLVWVCCGMALVLGACEDPVPPKLDPSQSAPGGALTVEVTNDAAFSLPAPQASVTNRRAFFVGNSLFTNSWVTAPASATGHDGLGPTFNAVSCASCHTKDGRGGVPGGENEAARDLLFRVSVRGVGAHGEPLPDPQYGDQIQPSAILGVEPEAQVFVKYREEEGFYGDGEAYSLRYPIYEVRDLAFGPLADGVMISPRLAPQLVGLGLLEAIEDKAILRYEDPDDVDGDGISGRANWVWSVRRGQVEMGRFGWKANQPDLEQQNAGAFLGDMGITSPLFPQENCPKSQPACGAAATGDDVPQIDEKSLKFVTLYTRLLSVPARRGWDEQHTRQGQALFERAGCGGCHVANHQTGYFADLEELWGQTIWPYTDLLLHDMGEHLADGRPDYLADGREWRTPPLWGLGLLEAVNGHLFLMHDGRARSFEEAILWHGGEGEAAKQAFVAMTAQERANLVTFLKSL